MLGVKRILRIGTCGGLQPDMKLGDLIVAISAVPADATATTSYPSPMCCADWELVHGAVHGQELGKPFASGSIVSSDLFYNPDEDSTHAGRPAGSSRSRWRLQCSSRSAR